MKKLYFSPFSKSTIRNIIFDLGGVIFNVDYTLTIKAFKELGFDNFDAVFTQANQAGIFDKLDKGLISPDEFREEIRKLSGKPLTNQQIDNAWNAMLLDFPKHRLELLERVRKHYRIFLLSNTNQIHINLFNQIILDTLGIKDLSSIFERVYFSHEIHLRKPDAEVFKYILEQNNLKAEESLFIDDSEQHVIAARKVGINAYHLRLKNGETIEKLFKE